LRGPAQRRSAGRARALTIGAVIALACGCASTPAATLVNTGSETGGAINMNTPVGVRAKQTLDMLNSDWPIGPVGIRTLAAPEAMDNVGTTMDRLWWDRPFTLSGVDLGAGAATLHLVSSFGARQDIEIHVNDNSMVDRFDVELKKPTITSWADVDAELTKSGARYSYQAAKVDGARCEPIAGTNTDESLPLASIFKLYVLYAVEHGVRAGTLSWDDKLIITSAAKAVGSSGFDELPPGAQVSVRTAAEKMIANSDNMATDLLIDRLGTHAIERALVDAGHHDPASMTPFPTMHELFAVGWGKPDVRQQWQQAAKDPAARQLLLQQTNSRPYEPDPERTHTPASSYGAEWYGSAEDICRVHAGLQAGAVGVASPVRDIMSAIPGIDLDRSQWPYIGAKAGNLPGDLTFSWYAVDRGGQAWVVSFQLNWPRYHGTTAGTWLLSIAEQVFAMLPRQS
jgi:beta-lactamase class A